MNMIDSISYGFICAILWAEAGDEYDIGELSEAQINFVKQFVSEWIEKDGVLDAITNCPDQSHPDYNNDHYAGVGHDLYLTVAGHGAGFWDGDYDEYGDILTESCKGVYVSATECEGFSLHLTLHW